MILHVWYRGLDSMALETNSRWIFGRNQRLDADGDKHASDNPQRRNAHNEERNHNLALPRAAPLASRTT
jgi:hypothetical protein